MPAKRKNKTHIKNNNIALELIKNFKGRVVVYIDAANLERSVGDLSFPPVKFKKGMRWSASEEKWVVDYLKLKKFFKENSRLVSLNFYSARFETKSHDNFLTFLKRNGYRLVTKGVKDIPDYKATISRKCKFCGARNEVSIKFECRSCHKNNEVPIERKANFDVEISVDAINWKDHYDTLVLFSGDSDFVYLLKHLKKQGKRVVTISRRGHVANELRKTEYVDFYEDIANFKQEILKKITLKMPKSASRRI